VGSERLAHLSQSELDRYVNSSLDREEARLIEQHVTACVACLQRVKLALRRGI
jgi:hypothetical protein